MDAAIQPSYAANIQDVHGAVPLLKYIGLIFQKLRHIFADRVYRGRQLPEALAELGKWIIEIITRSQSVGTIKAERQRWVIERTFAWLNRCRRLSEDFEETIASAEAWVLLASIRVLFSASGKDLNSWALIMSPTLRTLPNEYRYHHLPAPKHPPFSGFDFG